MTVKAFCIPAADTPDYLPRVYNWLDQAYEVHDLLMPLDLAINLLNGHRQLWVAWAPEGKILCGVITRLARRRSGLHCEVEAAGGIEVGRWIRSMATIEEYAKAEGCSKVTVQGRPGWAKLLQKYRRSQIVLELDI